MNYDAMIACIDLVEIDLVPKILQQSQITVGKQKVMDALVFVKNQFVGVKKEESLEFF